MADRPLLTLEDLDRGEALETVAALHGDTRASFLRKAVVGTPGCSPCSPPGARRHALRRRPATAETAPTSAA